MDDLTPIEIATEALLASIARIDSFTRAIANSEQGTDLDAIWGLVEDVRSELVAAATAIGVEPDDQPSASI